MKKNIREQRTSLPRGGESHKDNFVFCELVNHKRGSFSSSSFIETPATGHHQWSATGRNGILNVLQFFTILIR
jgi:hypothetical protein